MNASLVKGRGDAWMATVDIAMVRREPVFLAEVVMPDGHRLSCSAVLSKKPMERGDAGAMAYIQDHASALGQKDS